VAPFRADAEDNDDDLDPFRASVRASLARGIQVTAFWSPRTAGHPLAAMYVVAPAGPELRVHLPPAREVHSLSALPLPPLLLLHSRLPHPSSAPSRPPRALSPHARNAPCMRAEQPGTSVRGCRRWVGGWSGGVRVRSPGTERRSAPDSASSSAGVDLSTLAFHQRALVSTWVFLGMPWNAARGIA
jgi:hypothetical protein